MAAMHVHSFAAVEASADTQGTAAAAKTPAAAAGVAAADAGAALVADAADQAVGDRAAGQEACSPENKSHHHADQMVDRMGLGWHPSDMHACQHQHGDDWQDEEEVQNPFPLPRAAEIQPGIKPKTEQHQAEEEKTPAQQVQDGDRSIPVLGEEEAYRTPLDQAHKTNEFCVGQDRQYATENTCNALLQQQLNRIRQSAVMLPEPAEVLVTDLIDHR